MIPVLSNILYYLNLAALLHYHHQESIISNSSKNVGMISNSSTTSVVLPTAIAEDNVTTIPPVLVQQIPPGPILPGIVVKFVCAVNGSSICGSTVSQNEVSYQWEMYRYTEDQDGNPNCTSVVKLPGQGMVLSGIAICNKYLSVLMKRLIL